MKKYISMVLPWILGICGVVFIVSWFMALWGVSELFCLQLGASAAMIALLSTFALFIVNDGV